MLLVFVSVTITDNIPSHSGNDAMTALFLISLPPCDEMELHRFTLRQSNILQPFFRIQFPISKF